MPKSLAEYLSEVRRAVPMRDTQPDPQAGATAPLNDTVDLTQYRSLTPVEKTIISTMLDRGGSESQAFLPQIDNMMVKLGCTCGCPSLSFAPPPDGSRVDLYRRNIVADMTGEATDGLVGLILWQAGGKLTALEVYDLAGRDGAFGLPRPETLAAFLTP